MARKKINEGSAEERKKDVLSMKISQIRQCFFNDNNRLFSEKINVNEQALSQICSGKRNAGIDIVQRIIDNMPEIDANWLLSEYGSMLRADNMGQSERVGENSGIIVQHGDNSTYNNQSGLMQLVLDQQRTIHSLTEQNRVLTEMISNNINQ